MDVDAHREQGVPGPAARDRHGCVGAGVELELELMFWDVVAYAWLGRFPLFRVFARGS